MNNPEHEEPAPEGAPQQETRRYFMYGTLGVGLGAALLSIGTVRKLWLFFFGPRLTEKQEAELMGARVKQLEKTIEQKKYELEREKNDYILVSKLTELSKDNGKYFIDYQMRPALAFLDNDGLPILLSAKCTHLGCTVGSVVNDKGQILCPCHVSYFDIHTGDPSAGSPAKSPLAHIGWVLMDEKRNIVASRPANGPVSGSPDKSKLDTYSVFIAKHMKEKA